MISAEALSQSQHSIPMPLQLTLQGKDGQCKVLYCERVARVLPGKRLVVYGKWDGQAIVAKLFYAGNRAQRHAQRDARGAMCLLRANILTPALLQVGKVAQQAIHVVIYQRIEPAVDWYRHWCQLVTQAEKLQGMLDLIKVIANQHAAGLYQGDIYPDNFILSNTAIYSLDGADIRDCGGKPLSVKKSLRNLADLLGQFMPGYDGMRKPLLVAYCQQRGWQYRDELLVYVERQANRIRHKRQRKLLSKALRNCSEFISDRAFRHFSVWRRDMDSAELQEFFQDPERIFTAPDTVILKSGNTCTLARANIAGMDLVIKRYNIKNHRHALKRALRNSRARISWLNAQRLQLLGINTAKPIAMHEKRIGIIRRQSYFVMAHVEGCTADEYFKLGDIYSEKASIAIESIVEVLRSLRISRISHGDLKASNAIINHEKAILLDLDAMRQTSCDFLAKRRFTKDIKRFLRNWTDNESLQQLFKQHLM